MRFLVFFRVVSFCTVLSAICIFGDEAHAAQDSPNETQAGDKGLILLFNTGMTAFSSGNYAAAAASMEKVLTQAPPDAKLESVYYVLGASYFNLEQYAKAIDPLRTYTTKYPQANRLADANFSLGQACLIARDFPGAVAAFKKLENNPALREQVLLYEGIALKGAERIDEAIGVFEQLTAPGIKTSASTNGALLLAGLYAQKKQSDKALALIGTIRQNIDLVDNLLQFNVLATQIGDALLEQQLPREALACYRAVQSRAAVAALQNEHKVALNLELARTVAAIRAKPQDGVPLSAAISRTRTRIAEAAQLQADFQKAPEYEPALLIRVATCFSRLERPWESIVAYGELLRRYPKDAATREPALYGLVVASASVNRVEQAHALCEQYLAEFPQGPHADTVGYLVGTVALQANDPKAAETYFGRTLATQAQTPYREKIRFLLGNAQFAQGEYGPAESSFQEYLKDYPQGESAQEATYRIALCAVFSGKYEQALGLLNAYVAAYPQGDFVPDARYRLAVCQYAAAQNDTVISACQAWEKQYGQAPLLGEVLSLEGDAQAANGDDKTATDTYLHAYQAASTDEVSDYAVFAAQKLLQKAGDWLRMGQMFQTFVHDHPDRPSTTMAVYWIGKALTHENKPEEAKQFIAATIKQSIADPRREAVEQLMTQLATLCVRKTPSPAVAGAMPSLAGNAPPEDPGAEMDALLRGAATDASPLARARVLYAKSELARLRRQPAAQNQALQEIAAGFQPAELSAPLLGIVGDYLLGKGQPAEAVPFFEHLMNDHPNSPFQEYAYNGLGQAAYQAKDYDRALGLFNDALGKGGAAAKLKDVTVGKANTLLATGRFDEAKKLFEQIASAREWRGESTAEAVFSLGEIMRRQGKLAEAIVYYQRVFVGYQRYLPWVARAYAASAECFAQLGKEQEAANTYRELLKNPKLQDTAEAQAARSYLEKKQG